MEAIAKKIKVLCISDTHGQTKGLQYLLEEQGDIFIHAGDFTAYCPLQQIQEFCDFLDRLRFRFKIVICGNHEVHFDENLLDGESKRKQQHPCDKSPRELKELLRKHCIYLENQYITIEGVRIFGSPHAPRHGSTAFGYSRHMGNHVWAHLKKVDILITHGPPQGILDVGKDPNRHYGCMDLLQKVEETRPKFHIFGHIHQSGGMEFIKDGTTFANVAQCGSKRALKSRPYRFTIETDTDHSSSEQTVNFQRP